MKQKITPFFMFNGTAEAAIHFYLSVFRNSELVTIHRYGSEGPGPEGSVNHAIFKLYGTEYMAIDNSNAVDIPLTPATSFVIHCETLAEIEYLYESLSEHGRILMPLSEMPPVAERFCWIQDKFGVCWQLNLPLLR